MQPTTFEPITEPSRQTPVFGAYDGVVLGGGPAGIAAAAASARQGRSTLLVEGYGFLGGMGTAAGVTNFCGLHANVHGAVRQVVHGIADAIPKLSYLFLTHASFYVGVESFMNARKTTPLLVHLHGDRLARRNVLLRTTDRHQ